MIAKVDGEIVTGGAFHRLDDQRCELKRLYVADGTYFIVEEEGRPVGCGSWRYRATTYGGDYSTGLRNAALLDSAGDPVRCTRCTPTPSLSAAALVV